MQQLLSSDLILVCFSLLLGGLIGMFWERSRHDQQDNSATDDVASPDKR